MLDVRRLRLLRDLAHLGTIAAVAQAHSYTPSAVSQQLAALQREAGVPLLEHAGRRVRPTPTGMALVHHTETILATLEAANATLAAARSGLSGAVRIGAFPSAVRTLLPPALVTLGRNHPALDLMVTELDPVVMTDPLRDGRLDVALLHDYNIVPVAPDPALESTPLLDETVFLAVPTNADIDPTGDPIAGARDVDWIVGTPGTLCHTVALQSCKAAGFTPTVRHHADDFIAVLALVAAGQGVSLVPQLAATQPPPEVRLLQLTTRRRTRIAFRRGAEAHPAIATFVSALQTSTNAYLRQFEPVVSDPSEPVTGVQPSGVSDGARRPAPQRRRRS